VDPCRHDGSLDEPHHLPRRHAGLRRDAPGTLAIGREHGAVAIDMETETITRLCAERSIPMLALHVISDSPAAPFPAPPNVLFDMEAQRTKFTAIQHFMICLMK
jgi:purine-nucleoside phosphorylase